LINNGFTNPNSANSSNENLFAGFTTWSNNIQGQNGVYNQGYATGQLLTNAALLFGSGIVSKAGAVGDVAETTTFVGDTSLVYNSNLGTTANIQLLDAGSSANMQLLNPGLSSRIPLLTAGTTDAGAVAGTTNIVNFYVTLDGVAIPSTGYRYMSSNASYLSELGNTMVIPANANGTYFTFNNYSIPSPGVLQVPHDASIVGTFNTLQIIDDITVPYGQRGSAPWLEPLTIDYPQYGPGGATQAVTNKPIVLDSLENLDKTK
jgi:hypothetical protein